MRARFDFVIILDRTGVRNYVPRRRVDCCNCASRPLKKTREASCKCQSDHLQGTAQPYKSGAVITSTDIQRHELEHSQAVLPGYTGLSLNTRLDPCTKHTQARSQPNRPNHPTP